MNRPIVLPELPDDAPEYDAQQRFAIAAIKLDREGIVVTDEDVRFAALVMHDTPGLRPILETFAKRLRGEA